MNICVKFKTFGWIFTFHLGTRVLLEYYVFVDGFIVICSDFLFFFKFTSCLLGNVIYLCIWGWILCWCFIFPSLYFIWGFIYLFNIGSD